MFDEFIIVFPFKDVYLINEAITILTSLDNDKETVKDLYYSDDDESEEFDEEEDDEDEEDEDEEDNGDEEDNEDEESEGAKGTITVNKNHKLCKDPSNPLKCCSLFVCNFDKDITYQEMYNLFAKFGKIKNMRLVIQPKCYAFINYMESTSAGKAMKALQGCRLLVSTSPLIIKYPTTIINSALKKLKDPGEIKKLVSPPLEVSSKPTVIKQPSVKNCPATKRTRFTPNMKK
ncbi:nucleolin-like [Homalodisca vitripennis]|uniref:nucleolin-like n=1 Tax=Homalodisca vitripennis TaxID=197043 RepID=UPI001EEB435F|nr:nucleolin-like [Homalodisca vitripennis]